MATHGPTALPSFFNTDADFRSWVAGIRAALEAVGMVRTADTGQIDTATVAKPAAINTAQGYDIFRLDDTGQATMPIYVKVEYGSGGAVDRPSIWVTFGTGSNGSGTITGTTIARVQRLSVGTTSAGNTHNLYASGDGSGVFIAINVDPAAGANKAFGFMIDRPRDANGNPTTEGVQTVSFHSQSTTPSWGLITDTATSHTHSTSQSTQSGAGESKAGTEAAVAPVLIFVNGKVRLSKMFVTYATADLGAGTAFTVSEFFGGALTYMPLGGAMGAGNPWGIGGPGGSHSPAILWE